MDLILRGSTQNIFSIFKIFCIFSYDIVFIVSDFFRSVYLKSVSGNMKNGTDIFHIVFIDAVGIISIKKYY